MTLIPKVELVVSLKHLRPISLCNVSYKIPTKSISQRLNQVMETIISFEQRSFIMRRKSRANFLITQEMAHSMCTKKGSKGWMMININLEKAYDHLRQEFIENTMIDIGLPHNLIQVIIACITSPTIEVLWNGDKLDECTLAWGIRQGDPISPYLFVMCLERLYQLIRDEFRTKRWWAIMLTRKCSLLSHLAFMDDLVPFSEVSLE